MSPACKIRILGTAVLGAWLAGCPLHPSAPTGPAKQPVPGQPGVPVQGAVPGQPVAPHEGRPYDLVPGESLLTILAYRAGTLAKAGHNHVIASHDLTGTVYVPADALRSTFEMHMPVASLTIDEPQLRTKEGTDFPRDVPEGAKEGTHRNMLSEALLDGARFPDITLRSERLEPAGDRLEAHVLVTIRDQVRSIVVPVRYEMKSDGLSVSGELPLKQTDLGLTPFSALLGALQVQDEMTVKFRIVARPAQVKSPT